MKQVMIAMLAAIALMNTTVATANATPAIDPEKCKGVHHTPLIPGLATTLMDRVQLDPDKWVVVVVDNVCGLPDGQHNIEVTLSFKKDIGTGVWVKSYTNSPVELATVAKFKVNGAHDPITTTTSLLVSMSTYLGSKRK